MARKRKKLIEKRRRGYLYEVTNPAGKKAPVYIYQGVRGFEAAYSKSNRSIKGVSRNAESYARRLAREGHKKVVIRD